jgi:hypothetical protein
MSLPPSPSPPPALPQDCVTIRLLEATDLTTSAHAVCEQGARVLMEAISANSTLNQLALVMTGVSDGLQNEIEALVATCREQQAQALGASRIGSGQEENLAVPAS